MKIRAVLWGTMFGVMMFAGGIEAQEAVKTGRVTGLPIPRYISIKSSEAFMRRGPSQEYPIEWVFHRKGYPVRVIGESGHWRKVEDPEGAKGWFHYALLSGTRTVLVLNERISMRKTPAENSQIVAIVQYGVIGKLHQCTENWCEIEVERIKGWLPKSSLWGVDAHEVFGE